MKTKKCSKCYKIKSLLEFYKQSLSKDTYYSWCKYCTKKYKKQYRLKNKKILSYKDKIYQKNNLDKFRTNSAQFRKNHPGYYTIYNREYTSKRLKTDINFRLKFNLRSRIRKVLKGKNKSLNTMFLIGCEIDYLMFHIQEQFTRGMNWDNYGAWHIDHKLPCAKFDLSKKSEQLKCFNYTNLQPLWAEDNIKKGSK